MHALHLLYALFAPKLLKSLSTSVGRGTYGLVLKWERRESINIRVIRYPTRVTRLTKRTPKRAKIQKELTQERREGRLSGTICIIPLLYVFCVHSSEKTISSVTTQQLNKHNSSSMATTVVH